MAPPLAGHVNPLVAMGETLVDRGHRVSFLLPHDAGYLLQSARINHLPLRADAGDGHDRLIKSFGTPGGLLARRRPIATVAAWAERACTEAPALLRDTRATMLIADQMDAAAPLVARLAGIPRVTVATALPTDREAGVPPIHLGWDYDPSPFGRWRNRGGYRVVDWLMRPVSAVVDRQAAAHGFDAGHHVEDLSPTLCQAVPSIDFPRERFLPQRHYLGPLRRDEREGVSGRPVDQAPLIFCSFGSMQGNRPDLFLRIARACARNQAHLVIAHGGLLAQEAEQSLSGLAEVHAFVPQRRILRHAALAITHGGFNTVLDALSFGVPLLALPMAFEQHATAARIRYRQLGITLPPHASMARLTRAIGALLSDQRYRRNAAIVEKEIAGAGGVVRAADIVEQEEHGFHLIQK
jgi:UDP:flavonoid glycosyltransferase YjiC (YdhE family)